MSVTLPAFTPLEDSLFLTLYARPSTTAGTTPSSATRCPTRSSAPSTTTTTTSMSTPTSSSASPSGPRSWTRWSRRSWPATPTPSGSSWAPGSTADSSAWPPATVDWYDVDYPAVADARKRLIPEHPNVHVIGADVTDPDWLDAVPSDRPAIIVADGLMGFLTHDEVVSLWNRLVSHFPSGEIVLNSYTEFAIWIAHHARGTKTVADLVKFPGMDDPGARSLEPQAQAGQRDRAHPGNPRSRSSHRSGASSTS